MTDIGVYTQPLQTENLAWDITPPHMGVDAGGTLLVAAFTQAQHYPNGFLPSGTVLGQITASPGLLAPYAGLTEEVQTVTEGGSGLTSFTLTFSGQTTASLAAAATAAQVQTALQALSNVGAGNAIVTGGAGGPYTVTFTGALAETNVAQMTATPTGGSGTVTVATTTAGGAANASDGSQTAVGILKASVALVQPNGALKTKVGCAMRVAFAAVSAARLPFTPSNAPAGGYLDAGAKTALPLIYFGA
jgi:hypothetical protein